MQRCAKGTALVTRAPARIMKAHVLFSALALCLAFACNRPDSVLFGPDAPPAAGGDDGTSAGSSGTASSPMGGMAPSSGGSVSQGGSVAAPHGGTAAGGSDSGGGTAGKAAEMPGGAGQTGGADSPPEPPEPVCGNGLIEGAEECDDSGHAGMDGCSDCQVACSHFGSGILESEDHHCYGGYDEAEFEEAVAACQERGAHLVTITSAAENTLVRELVSSSKFIGGFEDMDLNVEGTGDYGWVTGEPFTYTNWAQGEPDMGGAACLGWGNERCYEHCLGINGQGMWEDRRCDQEDGYVCEWEPRASAR